MILSGADIVVRTIIEQGCDVVFGYPGGQVLHLYDSLYRYEDELTHVLAAHEQGAAHAADGYSRATGKVGVVIATSGPGATNLVTGIATAHLDSVPMVAITGNVPTHQIGSDSFQEIDITGITLPITKHNYFVSHVEELADTVREAFRLAMSGRPGPVLIDVPKDVQMATCEYTPHAAVVRDEGFPAKDIRITEAARCINGAKRPYIYFGGGVISGDAVDRMMTLAETIDAPMGCSLMGISALPTEHPRFLGMQGMHGHYAATKAMQEADCIICLGVRFNDRATGKTDGFAPKAKLVHIDIDGSELSKNVEATHGLRADIACSLEKLLPLLNQVERPEWQVRVEELRKEERAFSDKREGLTPANIIGLVNRHKSAHTPVVTDVGQHQMWAAQMLAFSEKRKFLSSGGLGTMGFGMGAAIGAAFGTGEHSLLLTGDGGFGMSLTELATAVTYKVPMVVLIFNNGVLGMVRQWQKMMFDERYSATKLMRKTDFVAVAKAFGAEGEAVATIEALDVALARAFAYEGPYVIDCSVDKDELVLPMVLPGGSVKDIITKME